MARIYRLWIIVTFLGVFFLILPAYYVFLSNPKWNRFSHKITRFWGKLHFLLAGIRVKRTWEFNFDPNSTYIFCPNHFSYADIPIIAWATPGYYQFVGKRSLEKIPFFGYMYRKLHIMVERSSKIDSYNALNRCLDALDKNINLVIYPEGGIVSSNIPQMAKFKDGPFRMAIEKGVSIVPVSIPNNWIFLPDKKINPAGLPLKITYHKPIETKGMSINDIDRLKETTRMIIQTAIDLENHHEN